MVSFIRLLQRIIRSHPILSFLCLTFAITWSLWLLPVMEQAGLLRAPSWWGLGSFGPSVTALLLAGLAGGRQRFKQLLKATIQWRVNLKWYGIVVLLPLVAAIPTCLLHWATGNPFIWASLPPVTMLPVVFLQILVLGGPLNEELGWRGWALPELQRRYSALMASLLLGAIWAAWHLPLFWAGIEGYTTLPFYGYIIFTMALSVIFTWVFSNTSGSVFMVILLHATFNTTNWLLLPLLGEQVMLGTIVYVLTVVAISALLVWKFGRTTLSAS